MEVEYGASPVRGIRIFSLDRKKLVLNSLTGSETWLPGEIKRSKCRGAPMHDLKPIVECTCGIWSCNSRKSLARTFPQFLPIWNPLFWRGLSDKKTFLFMSAQILQWGVVIEHEHGYRSEFAKIIPETLQFWPRQQDSNTKLVTYMRKKYSA